MDLSAIFAIGKIVLATLPIAHGIIPKWHENPCDFMEIIIFLSIGVNVVLLI